MDYKVIPPCDELQDVISHFWECTWDPEIQVPNSTYYVIANSLMEITFAFRNNNHHSELLFSSVQGQTHKPNQFPVGDYYHLLGVSFYSYAIPGLFNIPASMLNKEFISLNTFLGYEGTILTEKIAMATTTKDRIKILTDYFKLLWNKQRFEDKLITNAIKQIKQCNGNTKIIELASESFLSQKQFKRRFQEFSGFNPKMYARIIRFESFLKNYEKWTSLTEAAYLNGYYDQAHFIHEFKTFTGFSPTKFWELSKESS